MFFIIFAHMKTKITSFIFFIFLCAISGNLKAQENATPLKGEGITAFLKRHGYTGKEAKDLFIEINKNKFGKDGGLLLGKTYTLPNPEAIAEVNEPKTINEPLFGKELENVTINSNELSDACFYLVSGHGGPDPGAVTKVDGVELHEDEYAYDIILRLARNLMEKGATVHVIIQDSKDGIRDDKYLSNSNTERCMGDAIPKNQGKRLKQRCDAINKLVKKDTGIYKRAIFVHVDSRRQKEQIDVFLYHAPNSTKGQKLADNIRKTIENKYNEHQPNRGFKGTVSDRGLYVLRKSDPVAAFLELGNIQNEKDRKRLVLSSNRQALANWICLGIIADYKEMNNK